VQAEISRWGRSCGCEWRSEDQDRGGCVGGKQGTMDVCPPKENIYYFSILPLGVCILYLSYSGSLDFSLHQVTCYI
jgi:hypothetical protein